MPKEGQDACGHKIRGYFRGEGKHQMVEGYGGAKVRKYVVLALLLSLVLFGVGHVYARGGINALSANAHMDKVSTRGLQQPLVSGSAGWTSGGPCGDYINSLAMAAQVNPDIIYAGTDSALFRTTDGGAAWTRTGSPEMQVRVVQVAPHNPDIVYVGTTYHGIQGSEDGGSTWTQRGLAGQKVNALAIDLLSPHILYAGTGWDGQNPSGETAGVFKSTDGGETWQLKLSTGLDAVAALVIDTDNSSYIYAGVYSERGGPGIRKSVDGGETWVSKKVGRLWPWDDVVALAMTPAGSISPVIYAVNASDWDVFKSTDSGESWTPTNAPYISPQSPWALAVDPNNTNVIYVGTHYYQGRFYRSTDGGGTWSIRVNGLPPSCPSSIVIDPRTSAVYVGLSESGVYRSTDGAESWAVSSDGMNDTYIRDLAVHPTDSHTALAAVWGDGYCLATTANGGISWDYLNESPTGLRAVAIDPRNPSNVFVGDCYSNRRYLYVAKSTDGGQSWTRTQLLYHREGAWLGVSDIWVTPSDSSIVLAAVQAVKSDGGGVHRSSDGGATWQRTHAWSSSAATLAADPSDPDIIYFGTVRNGYVFRSTDGGSSWTTISPASDWVHEVRDIEVDLNSQVYVATYSGLMRWDGSVWTELTGLPTNSIKALAVDQSTCAGAIYAATIEDGVFVSRDGGNTWIPFNEGLGSLSVTELDISASQPKICYAGTKHSGVWSRAAILNWPLYLPIIIR